MLETRYKTVSTDMRSLIRDAQELFREAASSTGLHTGELRNIGRDYLDAAMSKAQGIQAAALEQGRKAAGSANDYIRRNPLQAIAVSLGLGFLIGVLLVRR